MRVSRKARAGPGMAWVRGALDWPGEGWLAMEWSGTGVASGGAARHGEVGAGGGWVGMAWVL